LKNEELGADEVFQLVAGLIIRALSHVKRVNGVAIL
jgi:hypothetical protein